VIVYKVLRKGNWSAWASGKAIIRYKVGEWRSAPLWLGKLGYHIFAFDNLYDARRFARSIGVKAKSYFELSRSRRIYEAEAEGVITELLPMLDMSRLETGMAYEEGGFYPPGTVMCEKIKLLKKVKL